RVGRRSADAGAVPETLLTGADHIALHLHPHWREMVRPMRVFLLSVGAVVAAGVLLPDTEAVRIGLYVLAGLALILVLWLSVWPWIVWRTTHYVFTNERVVLQHGVFRRERRDMPRHRVNDHSRSQPPIGRVFGSGTLIIDSAGEVGQATLVDVPKV